MPTLRPLHFAIGQSENKESLIVMDFQPDEAKSHLIGESSLLSVMHSFFLAFLLISRWMSTDSDR